jgi:hypothetical protein
MNVTMRLELVVKSGASRSALSVRQCAVRNLRASRAGSICKLRFNSRIKQTRRRRHHDGEDCQTHTCTLESPTERRTGDRLI